MFPSFVSRSPFPSTDKVTGGFLWHYGAEFLAGMQLATGETHRGQAAMRGDKTGTKETFTTQWQVIEFRAKVLSSEPLWLAHCFFNVLWHFLVFMTVNLPLESCALLPWCISYLEGKQHLQSQGGVCSYRVTAGCAGRWEGLLWLLGIQTKGCSSRRAGDHPRDARRSTARPQALPWITCDWTRGDFPQIPRHLTQMRYFNLTKVWHP